jgi:class 3 adenylate cyclase
LAALKQETAGVRATLAILYVETRGFTRMSEILEPAVVFARIAEFFALVAAAVAKHEGTVQSMLNDTLLATFAEPGSATRAVEAAQEIQREFTVLEEAWQRDYGIHTAVAMGLHSGDAVCGVLSSPLPEQVLIIGDGVSIAERLLHRARAGEFVLSKTIMDALAAAKFELDAEAMPPMALSRRDPIEIFAVKLDTRLDFTD